MRETRFGMVFKTRKHFISVKRAKNTKEIKIVFVSVLSVCFFPGKYVTVAIQSSRFF